MIQNLVSEKASTRVSWQDWYVWLLLLDNMHCLLDNMCWKGWLGLPSGRSRNFPLFASHQLNPRNQICRIRMISLSISSVSLHTFSIHRNLEDQEWNSLPRPNWSGIHFHVVPTQSKLRNQFCQSSSAAHTLFAVVHCFNTILYNLNQ